MGFEMVEEDHTPEHVAGVVYSVLTSPCHETDGCFDEFHLRKAIGWLAVEAGVHIRFVGIYDCYSHLRMPEGPVAI